MNKWLCFSLLLIALVPSNAQAQEDDTPSKPARLLIDKRVTNTYLVEGQEIKVNYKVYNVGDKSAVNVVINDHSLPKEYFSWENATNQIQIAKVQPSTIEERVLIFKPKTGVWGRFNFTFAEVLYASEGDAGQQFATSSEPGVNYIFSAQEFERRFSLHLFEWASFALLSLPSLLIPFLMWYRSKAKYDSILSAAKKEKKN